MPAGRPRLFKDPNELLTFFERYRAQVKSNPRIKVDYVGKDATRVEIPLETPLTLVGFKVFVWEEFGDIANYMKGEYPEFMQVVTYIKQTVEADQVGGALVGQYNANLTARLNGLGDKADIAVTSQFVLERTTNEADDKGQ